MLENDRYYLSLIIHHCSDALECCSEYTYDMFNKDESGTVVPLFLLSIN